MATHRPFLLSFVSVYAKPRVKRMHVVDAGNYPDGRKCIHFVCRRCGHDTGWIVDEWTVSENRRGRPCPTCNADSPAHPLVSRER